MEQKLVRALVDIGANIITIFISAVTASLSLFIFLAGAPILYPSGVRTVVCCTQPAAVVPLICTAAILAGFGAQRLWIAWAGLAMLFIFGITFVFSSGGAFLPFAALLLVFLGLVQTRNFRIAWLLLVVFLIVSVAINFPFAVVVLFIGGLMLLALTIIGVIQKRLISGRE
jgi:hypothetical protein